MVLPPERMKGEAGEDGQRRQRRNERQDADEADQHAVEGADEKTGDEAQRHRGPDRVAGGEEHGDDDAGEAGRGADAQIEIAHHHDDGHAGGDHHQH